MQTMKTNAVRAVSRLILQSPRMRDLSGRGADAFSVEENLDQLEEEALEVALAASHLRRGRADQKKLAREIWDLLLMLDRHSVGIPLDVWSEAAAESLDRAEERIAEREAANAEKPGADLEHVIQTAAQEALPYEAVVDVVRLCVPGMPAGLVKIEVRHG